MKKENKILEFLKNNSSNKMECIKYDIYKNWFYKLFYKNFSTTEFIFKYVQKKYKKDLSDMKSAISFFYEYEIENFEQISNETFKKDFLLFLIENSVLEDFFNLEKKEEKIFIGEYVDSIKRKLKKEKKLEEGLVYGKPYLVDCDAEYDTLIEIITTYIYAIPCYKIKKIKEDIYFVSREEKKDKKFYKEERSYDPNGYGTHYM